MTRPRRSGVLDEPRGEEAPTAASPRPHPWDNLIGGPENELAVAGVRALASGQREGISPLLVYGPSGVGKTRLLDGLAAEWVRLRPGSPIIHAPGAEFRDHCLEAVRRDDRGLWSEVHARFRTVDLLVLDDLGPIEGVDVAQDELAHVLDALEARGASVAVSCHEPPGRWPKARWPRRLVSRLAGGLTTRIEPPGIASRRSYLLEKAAAQGLSLAPEAIDSLAASADGYRTLDGWIARLALQPKPGGTRRRVALDLETVTALLADETKLVPSSLTIPEIARAVAAKLGYRTSDLRGPSREARLAQARHLAMYLARAQTSSSFAEIGKYFGRRDPATVRHACKAAAARLAADPSLAAALSTIRYPSIRRQSPTP